MNVCMLLTSYKNLAINYTTRCLACMVLRQANVDSKLRNSLQKTENNTVYKLVLPKAFSRKLFTTIKNGYSQITHAVYCMVLTCSPYATMIML